MLLKLNKTRAISLMITLYIIFAFVTLWAGTGEASAYDITRGEVFAKSDDGGKIARPYQSYGGKYYIKEEHFSELSGGYLASSLGIRADQNGYVDLESAFDKLGDGYIYAVFEDGNIVLGKLESDQKNMAVQNYRLGDYLIFRINAIMAGEKAYEKFVMKRLQFIYDDNNKIIGYADVAEEIPYTYADLVKQGMEDLSGSVDGVYGRRSRLSVQINALDGRDLTKRDIHNILRQRDNASKNYIVIFPQVTFDELRKDYPMAYNAVLHKENSVLGYESYDFKGSGYVVIMPYDYYSLLRASAHEAMHLLGVGDIAKNAIDLSVADSFDLMRYDFFVKNRVSNAHIYMMLKAAESKRVCNWTETLEELLGFVKAYGLHYAGE